jgi:hypothetical protein
MRAPWALIGLLTITIAVSAVEGMSLTLRAAPRRDEGAAQGGVVRVMELQEAGYAYIRP